VKIHTEDAFEPLTVEHLVLYWGYDIQRVLIPAEDIAFPLVPKLRLGTHSPKLCFATPLDRPWAPERNTGTRT
jgi:hypothetical protein